MARGFGRCLLLVTVIRGAIVPSSLAFTIPSRIGPLTRGRTVGVDVTLPRVASNSERLDGSAHTSLPNELPAAYEARLSVIKSDFEARIARQQALHSYEIAELRVRLLQGMVPLSAHEAIVESYEKHYASSLAEVMASNAAHVSSITNHSVERQREMHSQLQARNTSLNKAAADLQDMSQTLSGLKREVASLREALSTHERRAQQAQEALVSGIRQREVGPQRRRAEAAEANLSELRQATLGWLSAAQTSKSEAVAEARATGYLEGRAEAAAEASAEVDSLRAQVEETREAFLAHRAQSREERIALREATAEARAEAFAMMSAAGAAGISAIEASRDAWKAEGYAEGYGEGRAAAEEEFELRLQAAEESGKGARERETEIREAFSGYVVRAHEQRLELAARERASSGRIARGVADELARVKGALARVLQERITELEARRDAVLEDTTDALKTFTVEGWPQNSAGSDTVPVELRVSDAVTIGQDSNQIFWQDCGGRP